jgi:hypothetical protein
VMTDSSNCTGGSRRCCSVSVPTRTTVGWQGCRVLVGRYERRLHVGTCGHYGRRVRCGWPSPFRVTSRRAGPLSRACTSRETRHHWGESGRRRAVRVGRSSRPNPSANPGGRFWKEHRGFCGENEPAASCGLQIFSPSPATLSAWPALAGAPAQRPVRRRGRPRGCGDRLVVRVIVPGSQTGWRRAGRHGAAAQHCSDGARQEPLVRHRPAAR